jgi:hypothetical protein
MKANKELIAEACKIADDKGLKAIQFMILQYQKAIHFENYETASMMELAIHKFVCYHNNYAVQK